MTGSEPSEDLLAALREATGSSAMTFAELPELIPKGHETDVYRLRVRGGPPGSDGPLILRRFSDHSDDRAPSFEAAVHAGLRQQGFPVPRVLAARDEPPSFVLMECLPGRALGDDVEVGEAATDRVRATWALLRLSHGLPERLADTSTRLLALTPDPVWRAGERHGLSREAFGFDRHLDSLAARLGGTDLRGLEAGFDWLRTSKPAEPDRVTICHGDLAANLLLHDGRVAAVIDWSSKFVTIGDPAFEIANTRVMLGVPIPLPGSLQRAAAVYQRRLVRRFERSLGRDIEVTPHRVTYYEAWRRFKALLHAAEIWSACNAGAAFPDRPDPWCLPPVAEKVAMDFRLATGVAIALPSPPGL